uniref:Uncharacterized protein n=1 Tax=Trichuris muris TaxID=70415 RepID=A0A5S6R598_TRIMR
MESHQLFLKQRGNLSKHASRQQTDDFALLRISLRASASISGDRQNENKLLGNRPSRNRRCDRLSDKPVATTIAVGVVLFL